MPKDIPKWQAARKTSRDRVDAYYVTRSGETWRVYDTRFERGRHVIVPLGSAQASARVFVPRSGSPKRSYTFRAGDRRVLDPEELRRQLRDAAYVGKAVDTSDRTPW